MWPGAISECPSMYFGSDVVVSRLHADAACLKMDVCVCVLRQLGCKNGGLSEDRETF